jgi:acyl-CoA thioesterase
VGPARFARWVRYKAPQLSADGMLDPLAIPPIVDMMPAAVRQKIGPDGPQYYAPSLDLTVHFLDPTQSEWLLISTYARRARAGYATAEAEAWSEDGKLVAYATQTMILRTPGK